MRKLLRILISVLMIAQLFPALPVAAVSSTPLTGIPTTDGQPINQQVIYLGPQYGSGARVDDSAHDKIVFSTNATNIQSGPGDGNSHVYVWSFSTNSVQRVDVSSTGQGVEAAYDGSISSDGHFVAFSGSSPLLGNGIFRKDLQTGDLSYIEPGFSPVMTANGQKIVFLSSNQLLPEDINTGEPDTYLSDLANGTLKLISKDLSGHAVGSSSPVISGDGSLVSFYSRGSVLGFDNGFGHDYLYNVATDSNSLLDNGLDGQPGNKGASPGVGISANARYIVYMSTSTNLSQEAPYRFGDYFLLDRQTSVLKKIKSQNCATNGEEFIPGNELTISDSGRYISWEAYNRFSPPNNTNAVWRTFIYDSQLNGFSNASKNSSGVRPDGDSFIAHLSADGSVGYYKSQAQNLEGGYSPFGVYKVNLGSNFQSDCYVDIVPPNVAGVLPYAPSAYGWFNGAVNIDWQSTDPAPSSGTPTDPADTLATLEGVHTYTSAPSCDPEGNCATGNIAVSIDNTDPTISSSLSPMPNENGWNNSNVTATFSCADAVSGIASCTNPVTVSSEGVNQAIDGLALDKSNRGAEVHTTVKIDKTAPTISYSLSSDPNAAGWHDGDVTVNFSCSDSLSGIASCPTPVTLGEGANQNITGTATDLAGNSTSTSVVISVDKTKPTIAYSLSSSPNSNGWFRDDVTVNFSCLDSLSGVSMCTLPTTLSSEGANQSVVGSATDIAGNTQTITVSGINIDKTAPTVSYVQSPAANSSGWNNSDVTVTYTCDDALSGVLSCTSPKTVSTEGADQIASGTAVDMAGNISTVIPHIKLDKTQPNISYSLSPMANSDGWNKTDVIVTFTCSDSLSGVASCPSAITLSGSTANQSVSGTATDFAGNSRTVTVSNINIDKVNPTISYSLSSTPNSNGWNNSDVTVTFNCADALSGIKSCTSPVTVGEGLNQQVIGTATDLAGNTINITVVVSVDKTKPTIAYSLSPLPNAAGWNRTNVTVTFSCLDSLSGIQSCTSPVTLTANGANQLVTGTALDKAGNSASITASVNIDKTAPSVSNLAISPTLILFTGTMTITADASDALSGVAGGEYYIDSDPGQGNGTPMTYNASTGRITGTKQFTQGSYSPGQHTVFVRTKDAAGNWSTVVSLNFTYV